MRALFRPIVLLAKTLRFSIRVVLGVMFLLTIYLLPAGVALLRNKRNKLSIFFLNLLLGWTFIGWVVALVWGVSHRGE